MASETTARAVSRGVWSDDEHDRFREALELYPDGPWKAVAAFIGTRTVRQVQTHAQKYHEKAARRLRDLRLNRARLDAPNVLIDFEMQGICEDLQRHRVPLSPRLSAAQQATLGALGTSNANAWGSMGEHNLDLSPFCSTTSHFDPWHAPSFDECIDFLVRSMDTSSCAPLDVHILGLRVDTSDTSGSSSESDAS